MPIDVQPRFDRARVSSDVVPRRAWRRFGEARGWIGGFAATTVTARLRAVDGTPLVGSLLPGPAADRTAILLAHGFGANRRKPAYARLAEGLARTAPVLSLDLRGHGGSGGASTFGDREHADVAAGIRWLEGSGYDRVVLVGLSMGATAVLGAAVDAPNIAGLVLISAPARFRDPAPVGPLQRLERLWHRPMRRAALAAALGVRLAPPSAWAATATPVELVARLGCPLLVVHGRDDAYFPPSDAVELHAAAAGPSELWQEPDGFGHAEDGLDPPTIDRLTLAVAAVLADGRFPLAD